MKTQIYIGSYIILNLVMFILPYFSMEGYSIANHTTSQLGAQKTPNAWIMNSVFVLMGLISIYAGWNHYEGFWLQKILLVIFGISLAMTAFFGHAPINPELSFNAQDDKIHSLFASATGMSFTILAISTGIIKTNKSEMILPIVVGILASVLSAMMFKIEGLSDFKGIWQRMIFIISFGWMIYEFSGSLRK